MAEATADPQYNCNPWKQLQKHFVYCLDHLTLDPLIDYLFEKELITKSLYDEVCVNLHNKDYLRKVLSSVMQNPKNMYEDFLDALAESKNTHVAQQLRRCRMPSSSMSDSAIDSASGHTCRCEQAYMLDEVREKLSVISLNLSTAEYQCKSCQSALTPTSSYVAKWVKKSAKQQDVAEDNADLSATVSVSSEIDEQEGHTSNS